MSRKPPVDSAVSVAATAAAQNELALFVTDHPLLILTDQKKRDALFEEIEKEVEAFEPDLSTDTGRRAIASLAYKVARTKTAIDKAGLSATEEHRKVISAVNEERNKVSTRLDELRDKARKPLTEWEAIEAKRQADADAAIKMIRLIGHIAFDDTTATIAERSVGLKALDLPEALYMDRLEEAKGARDASMLALDTAFARIQQEEADRVELARLRKEQEERAEADRKRAEADRKRAEAEQLEQQRKAALDAERDRKAREDQEAEKQLELAERRELQRQQDAEIAAKKRADDAAEAARQEERRAAEAKLAEERAENDRLRKQEEERKAAEAKAADEAKAREADRAHRGKIMSEAKAAIITCGVDEDTAKKIVMLIRAGECPHVTITF